MIDYVIYLSVKNGKEWNRYYLSSIKIPFLFPPSCITAIATIKEQKHARRGLINAIRALYWRKCTKAKNINRLFVLSPKNPFRFFKLLRKNKASIAYCFSFLIFQKHCNHENLQNSNKTLKRNRKKKVLLVCK